MEFSFGLSGLVFSYSDYYFCNILISYSKLIMIKNNFFTLIIINIDNFPLKKKTLARDFRHIPVFHKGTILTCE